MKKIVIGYLIIALILGLATAQETGVDKLINSLEKNTAEQKKANKIIGDIEPHLEEKFNRMSGKITGSVSIFILGLITLQAAYNKAMQMRRKITLEKHLATVETRLQTQDEQLLKNYKRNNKALQTQYKTLKQHTDIIKSILGTTILPKQLTTNEKAKLIAIGTLLGMIVGGLI